MSHQVTVSVVTAIPEYRSEAERLAEQLQLTPCDQPQFILELTGHQLQLSLNEENAPGAIGVDFVGGKAAHRRRFGGGRGQPMAKAVGMKPGINPHIVDATAGLGRDSFVFASLGATVTMVEQNPVIAALLEDGLKRGLQDDEVAEVCQRMSLLNADSTAYLQSGKITPDVVYLDPMYPHREKIGLGKKEMRLFQLLLGEPGDHADLLAAALGCATKRVVVKRPKGAEVLPGRQPTMAISSKNTRYDIYVLAAMK